MLSCFEYCGGLIFLSSFIYICRGKGPKSYNGPWDPYEMVNYVQGEGVDAKKGPIPVLVGLKLLKGQSKEKCLLERDEYGSTCTLPNKRTNPNEH